MQYQYYSMVKCLIYFFKPITIFWECLAFFLEFYLLWLFLYFISLIMIFSSFKYMYNFNNKWKQRNPNQSSLKEKSQRKCRRRNSRNPTSKKAWFPLKIKVLLLLFLISWIQRKKINLLSRQVHLRLLLSRLKKTILRLKRVRSLWRGSIACSSFKKNCLGVLTKPGSKIMCFKL